MRSRSSSRASSCTRAWRRAFSMATPAAAARPIDQLLVDVGEHLGRRLVGQVEVAEHLVAHPDRHAEERPHRRVVRREPVAVGVLAQVGEPQRLGVEDEQPEDAVALGQVTDRPAGLVVDADGDELREARARLVEDAERAVAGVDQVDRGLDDALQHRGQVEVAADREHRVEQLAEAAGTRVVAHTGGIVGSSPPPGGRAGADGPGRRSRHDWLSGPAGPRAPGARWGHDEHQGGGRGVPGPQADRGDRGVPHPGQTTAATSCTSGSVIAATRSSRSIRTRTRSRVTRATTIWRRSPTASTRW